MSKRANGEGTIHKRTSDGRWTSRITLAGGKRKDFYGRTRQEVANKLATALKQRQDGLPFVGERRTVGKYLLEWLETVSTSVRPGTYIRYEQYVRLHANPVIGNISLARLSPQDLQRLYVTRLEAGSSPRTVRHLHTVLHSALRQAAIWGLTTRNVADLVTPPRAPNVEMKALTLSESRALIEAAQGHRLEALFTLALTTGMRQGELLAAHWRDVDLQSKTLQVRGTLRRTPSGLAVSEPKTSRSRRQISLGESTCEALQRHRVHQNAERLLLGSAWNDNDLLFANEVGNPIEATNLLRRSFKPILAKAGLPIIRFHDLRHTAATLLLGQGMHPKIVSEMLGHSQIAVTLDLYSHVTPTMQRQAADAMEGLLGG